MRTRIKICGITGVEDARTAAGLGADAIGLVFHERSPRRVDVGRAAEIAAALPPFCSAVALFVDAEPATVKAVLERVRVDLLQFHGEETPAYCAAFGVPYIKAVRMRDGIDLRAVAERYAGAASLLLDAWHAELPGGTGTRFDWRALPAGLALPVMLAGGLDAGNVAGAMRIVRPYGVDVSSGVEAAPGTKDAGRMSDFVRAVLRADNDAN
jgi:phosphoribosylanthranilate isomerase